MKIICALCLLTSMVALGQQTLPPAQLPSIPPAKLPVNDPVTISTCSGSQSIVVPNVGNATFDVTLSAACSFTFTPPTVTTGLHVVTLIVRPAGFQATLPASSSSLVYSGGAVPALSTANTTFIRFAFTGIAPGFGGI